MGDPQELVRVLNSKHKVGPDLVGAVLSREENVPYSNVASGT